MKLQTPVIIGLLISIMSAQASSGGSRYPGGTDAIYYYVGLGGLDVIESRPGLTDSEVRWKWIDHLWTWSLQLDSEVFGANQFHDIREKVSFQIVDNYCYGSSCLSRRSDKTFEICSHPEHIARVIYQLGQHFGNNAAVGYDTFLASAEKFAVDRLPSPSDTSEELLWIQEQLHPAVSTVTEVATVAAPLAVVSAAEKLPGAVVQSSAIIEPVATVAPTAVSLSAVANKSPATSVEAATPVISRQASADLNSAKRSTDAVKDHSTSGYRRGKQQLVSMWSVSSIIRTQILIVGLLMTAVVLFSHRDRLIM